MHRAADPLNIDLILLRFGEDVRNECSGYLLVNPFVEEVGKFAKIGRRHPMLVVGAQSGVEHLPSYDVDNVAIPITSTFVAPSTLDCSISSRASREWRFGVAVLDSM